MLGDGAGDAQHALGQGLTCGALEIWISIGISYGFPGMNRDSYGESLGLEVDLLISIDLGGSSMDYFGGFTMDF